MKSAEQRCGARGGRVRRLALVGLISVFCVAPSGCSVGQAAEPERRADVVTISAMASFEATDRAPVQFLHDLHTGALSEHDGDCTVCHEWQDHKWQGRKYLSTKFRRLTDVDEDELLDLYHENCIGCHRERTEAKETAGPLACGECHRREDLYVSSRRPFGMDKSLHYRHIKAAKGKCGDCHHRYDEVKKTLVYVEGEESSCRDCHRKQTEGNRVSFEVAAHEACIGCHRDPAAAFEKTESPGPESCAGCHDEERQLAIKRVENPPRLERKQPDFLLLAAEAEDVAASRLRSVPFSHVAHEGATKSCRVCHHETLDRCTGCHTLSGGEKGGGVMLYAAMHDNVAEASCVGCHALKTEAQKCSGCHGATVRARLPEDRCDTCHAGPLPVNVASEGAQYKSIDSFRPPPFGIDVSGGAMEVPEVVRSGLLSNQYEPAEMPHGKIVNKLRRYIEESDLAVYFHRRDDVVCQGCHHESPEGEKPPLCESCHDRESHGSNVRKPGLRTAYHQQCLGCHKRMNIQKPSDCFGCHARKLDAATAAASPLR